VCKKIIINIIIIKTTNQKEIKLNINTFINIASNLPPHIAVLMRGSTGIGKSAIVNQISKNIDLPLIDVRGSTMSDGDTGGYPDIEGMKENGVMTFCMPSWFMRACNEPVVLFLDELNRSLPTVQQSFFQIVLDRCLGNDSQGNPYNIHPETRIFAAVNHGSEYDVNEIDPALLRRFWTTDIVPDVTSWLTWATSQGIENIITEFISKNSVHFAPHPADIEPGKVFPTPASWTRLDESIKFANINLEKINKDNKSLLFNLCSGFIGNEASIEFSDFAEKYESSVNVEDILNHYDKNKTKIEELTNDRINLLIDRLSEHAKQNDWTLSQGQNVAKLGKSISHEMLIHMWSKISSTKNIKTIQSFHKYIGQHLVEVVNTNKDLTK
jgi:hypothetical protein